MEQVTQLLDEALSGDAAARGRFFARIYAELERLVRQHLSGSAPLTMLDASSLVHEVYVDLTQQRQLPGTDRTTFLAHAARVLHKVIMDYVRSRAADGQRLLTLNTGVAHQAFTKPQLEALGAALAALARIDERALWIVEMRYFGGLEVDEIAAVLNVTPAVVRHEWQKARAFLLSSCTPADPS